MAATFVADIKLDDSDEVFQLPLIRHRSLKVLWEKATCKLQTLGFGNINQLDSSLDGYLRHVGKFFGKDPTKWEQVGTDKVDVVEEAGQRIIRKTGVYSGTELQLFTEEPFHDERLPINESNPALNYDGHRKEIKTDEEWQQIVDDQPWTPSKRRLMLANYLHAKLRSNEPELEKEGAHGIWELAINKEHHEDIPPEKVTALLDCLGSDDVEVSRLSAAAIWGLATSVSQRQVLLGLGTVGKLLTVAQNTLKISVVAEGGSPTESQRNDLQAFVLGALSVLLVDRACREPLMELEPDLNTIISMCKDLEGYNEAWGAERRIVACKILTDIVQRDHEVRMKVIEHGRIRTVLELLDDEGPGSGMIKFCMASILATMVLDDAAMDFINERKQCLLVFECCLKVLRSTLDSLSPQNLQPDSHDQEELEKEQNLRVRLAEGCAQAIWGSAYFCALDNADAVRLDHVTELSAMGLETIRNNKVPLARVTHCISAALATFCSEATCAETIMSDTKDTTLKTLLRLLRVEDNEVFKGAGHVRAAAGTGLAFLACHPIGAQGDDCLTGPYREKLLDFGVFGGLLLGALEPPPDDQCKAIIEQSAAVGVMYLSTMAGDVDPGSLAALATLLNHTENLEMVEYLMAAMWILLRNPHNRKILSKAFKDNPGNSITRDINNKIQDAIEVYDVQVSAESKGADQKTVEEELNGSKMEHSGTPGADENQQELPDADKRNDEGNTEGLEEGQNESAGNAALSGSGGSEGGGEDGDGAAKDKAEDEEESEDNWGLETLVRVGENWLPRILEMNTSCDDSDAPLLKLFEFLSASMCLFLVGEADDPPPRCIKLFEYTAASGTRRKGWWTVNSDIPDVDSAQPELIERALVILTNLLHLAIPRAWKTMQLCCSTLWNITCRSPSIEKRVVEMGICVALLDIVNKSAWPASLRNCASGHLQSLSEYWGNMHFMGGLMPLLSSFVTLCNTRVPLLEMNGARGIARAGFHAPDGCPTQRSTLDECKAGVAQQGGIVALVKLLQRLNKRYTMVKGGQKLATPKSPLMADLEDDPTQYERDMDNIEAIVESYKAVLIALLNLSTLKINQVRIGKCGLFTLLGTSCLLAGHGVKVQENDLEADLILLCSAILQNISLHPKNRTRMYKAELRGSLSLGKDLGIEEPDLEAESQYLPAAKSRGGSPPRSPSPSRGERSIQESRKVATLRRPKVILPPICDETETTRYRSPLKRRLSASPRSGNMDRLLITPDLARKPSTLHNEHQDAESEESPKMRFLHWLDATFGELDTATAITDATEKKYSVRLPIVDNEGNWVNERMSIRSVNGLLCRPLCHIWENPQQEESPSVRWKPDICEYAEAKGDLTMGPTANKLLVSLAPNMEDSLQTTTREILGTGKCDKLSETASLLRPSTALRNGGRIPMTVMQPLEVPQGEDGTEDKQDESKDSNKAARKFPIKVTMSPKRVRTNISFADRLSIGSDLRRPHLTMFEHVEGARVYKELFPDYTLPSGKKAFYYYDRGSLINECEIPPLPPPERPTSVPAALQQSMPLAEVLNLIAKPPGSSPPFIPYKPVPRLVPLPSVHTLAVKYPESLDASTFGDLREDNLQLALVAKQIIKTITDTKTEKIEVAPQEEREPWTLPSSIFKARARECDAKDYFNTQKVEDNMFERDWARCCQKEKFTSMIVREAKGAKSSKEDKIILKEVHDVLKQAYRKFFSAFVYYASTGSGDAYHMSLNSFTTFLDDCDIPDPESQAIKRSDCDTIFIVANFVADKKAKEHAVNNEQALMRFEFMEAIVRLALSKHLKSQETDDVAEAVRMLLEKNVLPNLPIPATIVSNEFRQNRLYCEEVDTLYKKQVVVLKAIYSRYRLKPAGGGLRPKLVKIDGWLLLLEHAALVDAQFTTQDAELCFLWSRMYVQDEIKDYTKYESMTFVDFLEALGRVADMKTLPSAVDLHDAGFENVLQWALEKEQKQDDDKEEVFKNRPSAELGAVKSRPLYAKLECLLELIFRRLYYDPTQPGNEFTMDAVLKMIKKLDKDLGP